MIFDTFYSNLCAILYGLGSTMVSSVVSFVSRLDTFGVQALCLAEVYAGMRPGLCQ